MTLHALTIEDLFKGEKHCYAILKKRMSANDESLAKYKLHDNYMALASDICSTAGRNLAGFILKEQIVEVLKKHNVPVKTRVDHIIDNILKVRFKVDRERIYAYGGFLPPPS